MSAMRLVIVSRAALLTAVGWAALAGAAAAQDAHRATELDEVIVTGAPYGISARATTIATTVIDEEALASAPAASLGDLVAGLPGVFAAVAALRVKDPPRGAWDEAPPAALPSWTDALKALAANRLYVLAVAGYTAVTFASGALADWFPSHLERSLGMETGKAGLVVGGTAVVGGLGGTIVGGWLGDRLVGRTRQPYLALSTVSMAVALVFTVGALALRDTTLVVASMLLAQFFLWFYNGPVNAIIANSTDSALRARAFALSILAIHLLGDSISPTLVGWTSDVLGGGAGGLSSALMMVPASMAVGVAIWAWGWRRIPDGGPDAGRAA
jgi:hypothetical protein